MSGLKTAWVMMTIEDIEDIENGEVSNLSDLSDAEEIIRTKGNRRVKIVISDSDDDED